MVYIRYFSAVFCIYRRITYTSGGFGMRSGAVAGVCGSKSKHGANVGATTLKSNSVDRDIFYPHKYSRNLRKNLSRMISDIMGIIYFGLPAEVPNRFVAYVTFFLRNFVLNAFRLWRSFSPLLSSTPFLLLVLSPSILTTGGSPGLKGNTPSSCKGFSSDDSF